MPGFATPTRDSIEHALTHHATAGRIRSWTRGGPPPHPKWRVILNDGQQTEIRTYAEAKLFCAALASAAQAQHTDNAGTAADLARDLGTRAGELLRDCGRVTAGDREYLVIIPDGHRPRDPVYLRRDDGQILAARLDAQIREAAPGEAGPDASRLIPVPGSRQVTPATARRCRPAAGLFPSLTRTRPRPARRQRPHGQD